jgi:hypothetical protein
MSQTTNQIGLENAQVKELIEKLNDLLGKLPGILSECKWFSLEHQGKQVF